MPETLAHEPAFSATRVPLSAPSVSTGAERLARAELRRQIGVLERRLSELFASAFPRREIDWRVGAVGGPRLLSIAELERIRDALAFRIGEAQREIARRADIEEENRGLVEAMIAEPERFRWVRVSNEDVGEPGCRHWHSRPRYGLVGMLLGWWRVKLSSGCPLAGGRRPLHTAAVRDEQDPPQAATARGRRWPRRAAARLRGAHAAKARRRR